MGLFGNHVFLLKGCVQTVQTCSDLLVDPFATMVKTVLVSLDKRNRPATFSGTKKNLLENIRVVFKDQLAREDDVYLQIKDDSWGEGGGGFLLMFWSKRSPTDLSLRELASHL